MSGQKKITELTPEQEAMMPEWVEKWVAIGLSTEPADFEAAEKAVRLNYKYAGEPEPKFILRASSPWEMVKLGPTCQYLYLTRKEQIDKALEDNPDLSHQAVFEELISVLVQDEDWRKERVEVTRQRWNIRRGGSFWAYWPAYVSFFREVVGLDLPELRQFEESEETICKSCGWVWYGRDVCVLTDRPSKLERDENGQLHCEDGAALQWRDGWGLWAINGVILDQKTVEAPETLTIEEISGTQNADARQIMIQRFGVQEFLKKTKAKLIGADGGLGLDVIGSAPRAVVEDTFGDRWMVGTDGSTGRVYFMPVPRECSTPDEAHRAISGINSEKRIIGEC